MNAFNLQFSEGASGAPILASDLGRRLRSDGVLAADELAWCQSHAIAVGFDPVQQGWVALDCEDDISPLGDVQRSVGYHRSAYLMAFGDYVLRPWETRDADDLARMLSAQALWRFLPETYSGAVDRAAALELISLNRAAEHHFVLAVEYRGAVIGQLRLLFSGADTAEVSYWFGEAYWGRGHAGALVSRFVDLGFEERPQLSRIFARVHKDNAASLRVLEKSGFRCSGTAADDGDWLIYDALRDSRAVDTEDTGAPGRLVA
ncbi:MAG: GNAT family N-acetyltransferase [Pseudomonadota bacterium]